jgi:hypothetical protein
MHNRDWICMTHQPRVLLTKAGPNPYEDSPCQETNYPYERFFSFFPLSGFRWRQQSVLCSDLISVFGRQPIWLHQTRIEVPPSHV